MSETEFQVVALLAGLASGITAIDLLLCYGRHRRRQALARTAAAHALRAQQTAEEAAARRDAIRRRLSAIQVAGNQPEKHP